MSVLVVGLNHRTAPVGLLERLAVSPEDTEKALRTLLARDHVREAVVLSTCNRVEVYVAVTRYHGAMRDVRTFLCEWADVPPGDVAPLAYDYFDERAAAHLFGVVAGLDSLVVGERQIAAQVKEAFKNAQEHDAVGRVLSTLFRQSMRVAKRARVEVAPDAQDETMVDVALDAGRRVVGDLHGRPALVVGAGQVGSIAVSHLANLTDDITVANRDTDRAFRLASEHGGRAVGLDALPSALIDADVVLTSTAAARPVITYEALEPVLDRRGDRPLVLLDLALPRDVDPACAGLPGVHVLDVDGIRTLTASDRHGVAIDRARDLVEEAAREFTAWTRTVQVEPTIAGLRSRAEQVRADEVARLESRLAGLDERQREAVEALTKGIVNTLLHEPTVRLKHLADHRSADVHAAALRELFGLADPDAPAPDGPAPDGPAPDGDGISQDGISQDGDSGPDGSG